MGAILPFLLFAIALNFGVLRVAGSPKPVKEILADSGIYGSVVGSALDQAKKTAGNGTEVSLIDPAIKKAAEESFNPQVVQSSTESVIDGVYHWLEGKSPQPDFNIDLTSVKTTFAEKVGQAAQTRAATLPICTTAPVTTDPFSATCLPPRLTPAQVGEQAKNTVLAGQGFLEHPNITYSNIKSDDPSQQNIFDNQLKDAPKRYQMLKKAPIILGVLAVLAIVVIIFLSESRRKGLRRVGITLIMAGAFMLLFAWGLNRIVNHNVIPNIKMDNGLLQTNLQILVKDITLKIDQNYWIFGGTYAVLGILAIAGAILMQQESKKSVPKPSDSTASVDKPKTVTGSPKRKNPPKIQG